MVFKLSHLLEEENYFLDFLAFFSSPTSFFLNKANYTFELTNSLQNRLPMADSQWPPLESNPEVFTSYLHGLGMSEDWVIGEVK